MDILSPDIHNLKTERLGSDIINFGLVHDPSRDGINLMVVRDDGIDRHHICDRYEIIGLSLTMAGEMVISRVREIVKFYPPLSPVTAAGADEYDEIMQAKEIMKNA